jgi:hypothetical protein
VLKSQSNQNLNKAKSILLTSKETELVKANQECLKFNLRATPTSSVF